jgi:hypothetical protein
VAPWLEHPRYIPARERVINALRSAKYKFPSLSPVLFLCGGATSPVRNTLRDYLRKHSPTLSLFYAEHVWDRIASQANRNLLEMEEELAGFADMVAIIVESPGTFAELGAFSLSEPLRKKLLPIVDTLYANQSSFISTGPLRWIDRESDFKPTIYVQLSQILKGVEEIEERIKRIPKSRAVAISDLSKSPKHLLFFLCDLTAVIYPATIDILQYYLSQIAPSTLSSKINVETLIGLATAMNLLYAQNVLANGRLETYFSPTSPDAVQRPYHHPHDLDLSSQRAAHVSVLFRIPQAKAVFDELRGSI